MAFELKKLSDLCTKITDGSHYSPKEVVGGVPMYSVKDMTQFGFSDKSVKRISNEEYEALVKADCTPRLNDVLIAKDGSVLKHVFAIESEIYGALLSSIAILRPNLNYVDPDFLVYALQDPVLRNDVLSNYVSGSGVPRIVLKDFKNILIKTPPLAIQKKISAILKSLDKQIQMNLAVSDSLEEISQTIFKSWFIDFDPVKAKMAGEKPAGMDAATSALFPDSMVESEAGLIPRGWEVSELISLVDSISDGDWIESKDQSSEGYRLLQIGNIGLGEFLESGKERYVSQETFKRLRCTEIMPGDVLVARMPDPTGRSWFVDSLVQPAITSVDVAIIRAHPSRHSNRYVSMFLNLPSTLKLMESLQTGSTRQRIKRTYIETLRIITPDAHVLAEFDGITGKLFGLSDSLRKESRALKGIRDSLLPRLISGELQIPEEMLAS